MEVKIVLQNMKEIIKDEKVKEIKTILTDIQNSAQVDGEYREELQGTYVGSDDIHVFNAYKCEECIEAFEGIIDKFEKIEELLRDEKENVEKIIRFLKYSRDEKIV